eukprot:Nitzschia sp. Nitz4//scaffold14_size191712//181727//183109//NITZ4_BCAT-2//-1//CDS//3329537035//2080//frame0
MPNSELLPPKEGIEFEALPWNMNLPEEVKYVHMTTTSEFTKEHYDLASDSGSLFDSVYKYSETSLPIYPSTTSLNYGTTIWEGLKCFRDKDGKPVVFRPDRNFDRFVRGAEQFCLPPPSKELFLRGIQHAGNYFKNATGGLNLHLETRRSRAARGGVGNVKCAGNYGTALKPYMDAKKQGFHDNLFLELETYSSSGNLDAAVVQEMSAANVFFVLKTGEIVTPSLERNTILPGVTRESVITLVEEFKEELKPTMLASTGQENVSVSSRDVTVGEIKQATEGMYFAFCTGTAAELVPIARLATGAGEDPFDMEFAHGKALPGGPVTVAILTLLRQVMTGEKSSPATAGWLRDPFATPEEFCK